MFCYSFLFGFAPLVVEAAVGSVGCALHDELTVGCESGAESGEGCGGVAGPAREFATACRFWMVRPVGVFVGGADDAELAVELRVIWPTLARRQLPRGNRLASPAGGIPESLDDAEDAFGSFAVCATWTMRTPRAVMVLRKKRPAIQVVMPIWQGLDGDVVLLAVQFQKLR